ncbi:MAG TPA: Holliday junction resolvase RuvX, partial [Gallionella sp.]|nr:Holliday junction resolvase RuvX [Gallionella sp.]
MPEEAAIHASVFVPQGTLLAFDFGTRRIGIAVGNTLLRRANPLATIDSEKTDVR